MNKWKSAMVIAAAFCIGWISADTRNFQEPHQNLRRVTSIGGIFFKCKNPVALKKWYSTHLGLHTGEYGTNFEWRHANDSLQKGYTLWGPFNENTRYFEPSQKQFMINYRVADLLPLVEVLKKEGVTILDEVESFEYGKFVHIMDLEGNKIELWEPNDVEYERFAGAVTK